MFLYHLTKEYQYISLLTSYHFDCINYARKRDFYLARSCYKRRIIKKL